MHIAHHTGVVFLNPRSKNLLANALADGGHHAYLSVSPNTAPESSHLSTAIYLWNMPVLDMFTQRKAWQFKTLLEVMIKHEIGEVKTLEKIEIRVD